MLSNNLNTNEVKNSAGVEVEFQHLSYPSARSREFAVIGEAYNLPHRLMISHQDVGTGASRRRRSVVQVRKSVAGVSTETRKIIAQLTVDIPEGDLNSNDEVENVIAELISFVASTGATTTILYDCSGNGAVALKDGSL